MRPLVFPIYNLWHLTHGRRTVIYKFTHRKLKIYTSQLVVCTRKLTTCLAAAGSGVFVVVVEVDAKQEVLQVRLVASVHQFGYH